MTPHHRSAGWSLIALSIALASCESIPPVSHRHRIYRDSSTRVGSRLFRHLPYHATSGELVTPVRGLPNERTVNRAFVIFDLTAYLNLVRNSSGGPLQGAPAAGGKAESQPQAVKPDTDLADRARADLSPAAGESEVEQRRQEDHVASAGRFASQAEFEDYLSDRAADLRVRNEAIADVVEQDPVLRMIFQHPKETFTHLLGKATISRDDLMQLRTSISVDEIVPGETFEYTLEARNTALATIRNVTLYDELPSLLHFERNFRATLTRADGGRLSFDDSTHPAPVQSVVTVDEWERGKICWIVATDFHRGDTLKLSFDATWYRSRGAPTEDGVPLYAGLTASDDEVVTRLDVRDRVFLIEPSAENEDFLHVFIRRPVETTVEKGNKATRFEKLHGFVLAEHYRAQVDDPARNLGRHAPPGGADPDVE